MIAKCPCQHCGVNIEFATEEFLSGSSVPCPTCGKETALSVSHQAKPAPKPAAPIAALRAEPVQTQTTPTSTTGTTSTAATLKQIRQQTCYKTLRGLIDLVQILFFVAAGLAVLGVFADFFEGSEVPAAGKFLYAIVGVASAFILIVLGIAWKQAALLLVDIADCQIRLAGNKS